MAQFQKGNPGRPKGAKNKSPQLMRDRIQALFDNNFELIQEDLESLNPKDRLKFLTDLIPYLLPKLQTTTFSQKIDFQELNEDDLDILIERIMNE
ncbi:MAG: hypothetical protein FJY21_13330 [Bacteroidetes bacterium]|nr:hypothetical protein [Bacteroidota bacterium]